MSPMREEYEARQRAEKFAAAVKREGTKPAWLRGVHGSSSQGGRGPMPAWVRDSRDRPASSSAAPRTRPRAAGHPLAAVDCERMIAEGQAQIARIVARKAASDARLAGPRQQGRAAYERAARAADARAARAAPPRLAAVLGAAAPPLRVW